MASKWSLAVVLASTMGCEEAAPDVSSGSSGEVMDDDEAESGSGTEASGSEDSSSGEAELGCVGSDDCDASEYCDEDGTCRSRGGAGTACEGDPMCLEPLLCILGECNEPQPTGSVCEEDEDCEGICFESSCFVGCDRFDPDCAEAEFCWDPPAEGSSHCRPRGAEGDACDSSFDDSACLQDLYCDGSLCRLRLPEGANCDYTDHWPECEEGLACNTELVPPLCEPA